MQWLAAVLMAGSLGVGGAQAAPECAMIGPWSSGAAVGANTFRNPCANRIYSINRGYTSFNRSCGWTTGRRVLIQQPRVVSRTIITEQPEVVAERLTPVRECVSVNRYARVGKYLGFHRITRATTYRNACRAPALEAVAVRDVALAPVAERIITRTTTQEVSPPYSSSDNDYLSCP